MYVGKNVTKSLREYPNPKQRGELFDFIVQYPEVLDLNRKKEYNTMIPMKLHTPQGINLYRSAEVVTRIFRF